MRELQDRAEHLQRENDRLWPQVEKRHDLDERDVQDNGQARHPTAHDKGAHRLRRCRYPNRRRVVLGQVAKPLP